LASWYRTGVAAGSGQFLTRTDLTAAYSQEAIVEVEEGSFVTAAGQAITVYAVFAGKDDVAVQLVLEAPTEEFDAYRGVYEAVIRGAKLFTDQTDRSDNRLLDHETDLSIVDAMQRYGRGDLAGALELFQQISARNPIYAKWKMSFGALLLYLARDSSNPQEQEDLLSKSRHELEEAIELYYKYPDDYLEEIRKIDVSQCYFLLGEGHYAFPSGNRAEAKRLYERALTHYPDNPSVQRALEQLQSEGAEGSP